MVLPVHRRLGARGRALRQCSLTNVYASFAFSLRVLLVVSLGTEISASRHLGLAKLVTVCKWRTG